ncbi:formylmethanofuran dehydrogenase subunit E [Geoanaerobacter pelophilus]|uniref:Formylmethanofuran dehydrogenase subunit E n=1 Tax=Geoanaerobacter pelophilus TaxID=60036 RepID=A0ABQ0MEH8_9BACT|nr:formylmethanofuran dehydrogenase subunit E family protein [Geoanaerobacter pelophilus]GAW65516.1 formylmethanofuran dehydrogenase subunit E [Geoanaerobacter pelophilus]
MVTAASFRKGILVMLAMLLPSGADALAPAPTGNGALFETLERFHGHACAGSLIGARLGLAAKTALKAAGGEGKLRAKYFANNCSIDGVQVAAGTTSGNKAIEVVDDKESRLLLSADKNGRQVEARLTRVAEEKGKKFRELRGKGNALPVGSPERQQVDRAADDILGWFRNAPDVAVVQVRVVK